MCAAETSAFLRSCGRHIQRDSGLALDIPCGYGRHRALLAAFGYAVISADKDIAKSRSIHFRAGGYANFLCLDGFQRLPFLPESFDLVVCIHPPGHEMALNARELVKPGGYLAFETFGSQGRNALNLPMRGLVSRAFADEFEAVIYSESSPSRSPEVATVKALFRRRETDPKLA